MSKIQFDMSQYLNKTSQPPTKKEVNQDFEIKMISVYDLIPNPLNFYELSDIKKLEAEIELQGGIMTNLEVKAVENGKYMIIAGHRRRQAIINLLAAKSDKIKSDKVPCTVNTYKNQEEEIKALSLSNRSQRKKTPTEELKELQALKPILQKEFEEKKAIGEVSGRFRAYIAEFLGISESTVQRIDSRAKLDEDIKQDLNEGKITPTAAAELTSLSAAEQKAVYEDTTKQGKTTVKAIQEQKENLKKVEDEEIPTYEWGAYKNFDTVPLKNMPKTLEVVILTSYDPRDNMWRGNYSFNDNKENTTGGGYPKETYKGFKTKKEAFNDAVMKFAELNEQYKTIIEQSGYWLDSRNNEYQAAATKNFADMLQKEIETAASDMQKSTDEEEQKYISAYIEVLGRHLEIAQNEVKNIEVAK